MIKRGILILAVSSLVLGFFAPAAPVSAAACTNTSSFGAVKYQVPDLINAENQKLWLRMQGSSGDRVLVELGGSECFEFKLQSDSSESWSWQTLQAGGGLQTVSFPKRKGNDLKIIGMSDGVRVDRVLITSPECTPEDFGNNCRSSVSVSPVDDSDVIALAALAKPISGKVHVSPTVQDPSLRVKEVKYTVNGQVVQHSSVALPLDTTLLENGRHTVRIATILADGEVVKEMVVADIKNPENALTPLVRWVKRNQTLIWEVGLAIAVLAALAIISRVIVRRRRSRRERTFRGL